MRFHVATTWPVLDGGTKSGTLEPLTTRGIAECHPLCAGPDSHVVRYEVARTGGIPRPARHRTRLALRSCGLQLVAQLHQLIDLADDTDYNYNRTYGELDG